MNINNQLLMERLKGSTGIQPSNSLDLSDKSIPNVENGNDFFNTIKSSISSLEESQLSSDHAIEGLVTGEADNLHQVMIQTSEAQISLELAVQLRNKCMEAMNEIKGMQF